MNAFTRRSTATAALVAALTLTACSGGTEATTSAPQQGGTATSAKQGGEQQDPMAWFDKNCPAQVKTPTDEKNRIVVVQAAVKPPVSDKKNRGVGGNQPFRLYSYDVASSIMTPMMAVDANMSFCMTPNEAKIVSAKNPTTGKDGSFYKVSAPNLNLSDVYIDAAVPTRLPVDAKTYVTQGELVPEALWSIDTKMSPLDKAANVGSGTYCDLIGGCGG